MKKHAFGYLKAGLLAVLLLGMTACEVEIGTGFYDDDSIGGAYYSRSQYLCSRTWTGYYTDSHGNRCYQEIDFYLDRSGVEFRRVYYPGGLIEEFEERFRWGWENYEQTALHIAYAPNDVSFLEDVYLGGNVLSGYWNNTFSQWQGK